MNEFKKNGFKSGIILKDRILIPDHDSFAKMTEEFLTVEKEKGKDDVWVRAKLVPDDDAWWTDPADWSFEVVEEEIPEWFKSGMEEYETRFREEVCKWWCKHVLVGRNIEELERGEYRLMCCEIGRLTGTVKIPVCYGSSIGMMQDNARVGEMLCGSRIHAMFDDTKVEIMRNTSRVDEMWGKSEIGVMYDSTETGKMNGESRIREMFHHAGTDKMRDFSCIDRMRNHAKVKYMYDEAMIGDIQHCAGRGVMLGRAYAGNLRDHKKTEMLFDSSRVDLCCS